ncbi:protein CyaY [Sideroxyarcus emersonii]|uniref:Protein CyaY n=1 Tax=Sideroxyarcus emersonii TaxID=2764705 RepID=A0AAN1X8M8_9PROT|nr:aspartyl protease family protein [Sideroxyarcus emersonii]BCK86612.1 protein CyaY [Sideroxyarcus emersonii]
MTESPGNEPRSALFARIRQMVDARSEDIRQHLDGNALRLEFADKQRILINLDARTNNVWLAARTGGIEFIHHAGTWRAHDQSELFARLNEAIDLAIASDPRNARARMAQATPSPVPMRTAGNNHMLRNVVIVLLASALIFWSMQRPGKPQASGPATTRTPTLSLNQLHYPCEGALPANGNVSLFPANRMRTGGPDDPEVTLKNDHPHPVLLILTAAESATPSLSILVHAGQVAAVRLPAGRYDMMFSVGDNWCNPRNGFSEGHLLKFDQPLSVQAGKPVQVAMQTSGSGIADLQVLVKTFHPAASAPLPNYTGDGRMQVARHADGHFYLPGSIDDTPIVFMLDTDSPVTSVSSSLARQAGIRNCKAVQPPAANTPAAGCIALVPHMKLGRFALENITVAVLPDTETNLLGTNVLRNFQVSQHDSQLLIGRR